MKENVQIKNEIFDLRKNKSSVQKRNPSDYIDLPLSKTAEQQQRENTASFKTSYNEGNKDSGSWDTSKEQEHS